MIFNIAGGDRLVAKGRGTGLSFRGESTHVECLQEKMDDEAHCREMREGGECVRSAFLLIESPGDCSANGIACNTRENSQSGINFMQTV